jgi:hypothetical protein
MVGKQIRNKHSEKLKQFDNGRLENYRNLGDIEYALQKRFGANIDEILILSDKYLTLSQCRDMINQDIENKLNDYLIKHNV